MARTAAFCSAIAFSVLLLGAPVRAEDPEVFRIGGIFAMSGAAPLYGAMMSRGVSIAVDEINGAGGIDGIKLEFVVEDHKSGNAEAAVAGMNRLITISKVQAVLPSFSGPTLAIAPIADENGIFIMNGGAVSPRVVGISKNMFHNRSLATDLANAAVRRAHDRGFKSIAQISTKSEFGDSVMAASRDLAAKLGMTVVAEEQFATEAPNIDTQVAKLRASKPDVVLSWPTTPKSGMVVKRVRELGMVQPIITMEWSDEDTKLAGVANSEGVEVVTDYFAPTDDNPMGRKFYDEYVKRYGGRPDYMAANYYEGVTVIAELIRRAKAMGGEYWKGTRLTQALRQQPSFPSVYGGEMTFQENGVALKRVAILRIENGELKLKEYLPAGAGSSR